MRVYGGAPDIVRTVSGAERGSWHGERDSQAPLVLVIINNSIITNIIMMFRSVAHREHTLDMADMKLSRNL